MSDPRRDVRAYDEVLAQLGEANSRRSIPTPALVCDLSLLLANIERMANRARDAGVALRPHVKSTNRPTSPSANWRPGPSGSLSPS